MDGSMPRAARAVEHEGSELPASATAQEVGDAIKRAFTIAE
jgi:hypothetical protein